MRINYEPIIEALGFKYPREVQVYSLNAVFTAESPSGETVAIKMPKSGTDYETYELQKEHIKREARVLESIKGFDGLDTLRGAYFLGRGKNEVPILVRKFVQGDILHRTQQRLNSPSGLLLCAAVGELHSAGFANLDIKPENVIIPQNVTGTPTLIDFGSTSAHKSEVPEVEWNSYKQKDLKDLGRLFN